MDNVTRVATLFGLSVPVFWETTSCGLGWRAAWADVGARAVRVLGERVSAHKAAELCRAENKFLQTLG